MSERPPPPQTTPCRPLGAEMRTICMGVDLVVLKRKRTPEEALELQSLRRRRAEILALFPPIRLVT